MSSFARKMRRSLPDPNCPFSLIPSKPFFTFNGGPMTRNVADTARLLDVMAGYDPNDPVTALSVGKVAGFKCNSKFHLATLPSLKLKNYVFYFSEQHPSFDCAISMMASSAFGSPYLS